MAEQGGSYVVGADGEESLVERTKPAPLPHEANQEEQAQGSAVSQQEAPARKPKRSED